MSTSTLLHLCLILHLTGLVMMAGMSVADLLAYSNFWKLYVQDKQKALSLFAATVNFQKFLAMGAGLLLLTGIAMMALTHGVFGEQLWMKIKLSILVLIIINGPIVGRMQASKLRAILFDNKVDNLQQIMIMKRRINLLSIVNLLFLATIIILSVFKFN